MGLEKVFESIKNLKTTEKIFFISIIISSFIIPLYFSFYLIPQTLFSIGVGIITVIMIIIYFFKFAYDESKWLQREICMFILMFILIFHLPTLYFGSSRISHSLPLKDNIIIKGDKFFLGHFFPLGQLSLYLDTNNSIGPHTKLGSLLNNFLQIFYSLYYIIPYIFIYILCYSNCIVETVYRYNNNGNKSKKYNKHWSELFFIFSVYIFIYSLVFIINTIIPASSPRLYLQNKYIHYLKLSGISKFLNRLFKDNGSANSFPSGHVAESLCISIALFGMKRYISGSIAFIFSFLIALATLFLRYHYFCDVLCAILISIVSFIIPYYVGFKNERIENEYECNLNGKDEILEKIPYLPVLENDDDTDA